MAIEPLVLTARVGRRCCSTRLGRWGRIGGAPPARKGIPIPGCVPRVSRPCRGWQLGLVPGRDGGISPLVPPPCPASRPGDALGATSSLLPAKRIGFREVCDKTPAELIPAAISDNKALY